MGMKSLKISYKQIKFILSSIPKVMYGTEDKIIDHLYSKGIFTYKRNGQIQKTGINTIEQYISTLIKLEIFTEDCKLTNFGDILYSNVSNEHLFKKMLRFELEKREDVKTMLYILEKVDIHTNDYIKNLLDRNISNATFKTLLNLCADCGLIYRTRKTSYYLMTIRSQILKHIKDQKKTYTMEELDRQIRTQGYSNVEFQEEMVKLLVEDKINLTEQLPDECLQLLKWTLEFEPTIIVPITIKIEDKYINFLKTKGIDNPSEYIKTLAKKYYKYLEISPYSTRIDLLVFKTIGNYTASIIVK